MSRFGDFLGGKKAAPAPTPTPVVEVEPVAVPTPPVEETRPDLGEDTTNYDEVIEEELYESDVSLQDMSKKELEDYGRIVGIELDRRHSRKKLVQELEEYLTDS